MYKLNLSLSIIDGTSLKDLAIIKNYVHQFKKLPYPQTNTVTFIGNDVMRPYFNGASDYIQKCAEIAASYNMMPVLKTNAVWGKNPDVRRNILQNIALIANQVKTPVGIDLGIKCADGAAPIVSDVVNDLYLSNRIQLSGHTTDIAQASDSQIESFIYKLNSCGINTIRLGMDGTIIARHANGAGFLYPMSMTFGEINQYLTNVFIKQVTAPIDAKFGDWQMPDAHQYGIRCKHEYMVINRNFGMPLVGKNGLADAVKYYADIVAIRDNISSVSNRQK